MRPMDSFIKKVKSNITKGFENVKEKVKKSGGKDSNIQ